MKFILFYLFLVLSICKAETITYSVNPVCDSKGNFFSYESVVSYGFFVTINDEDLYQTALKYKDVNHNDILSSSSLFIFNDRWENGYRTLTPRPSQNAFSFYMREDDKRNIELHYLKSDSTEEVKREIKSYFVPYFDISNQDKLKCSEQIKSAEERKIKKNLTYLAIISIIGILILIIIYFIIKSIFKFIRIKQTPSRVRKLLIKLQEDLNIGLIDNQEYNENKKRLLDELKSYEQKNKIN